MQSFLRLQAGLNRCLITIMTVSIATASPDGKVYGQATSSDNAGNQLNTARNIGILSARQSFTDFVGNTDTDDYYKFSLSSGNKVSLFVNGLAAGTALELRNSSGSLLQSSINSGTTWSPTNGGTTGGSITANLTAGTYYVRVTPAGITGNPLYANKNYYNLTLQPHRAANTVTVAASNTLDSSGANYLATGLNDQEVINRAIADVGMRGGGTVLLLAGTFNISSNILILKDNITLSGVGWSTVVRLANNTKLPSAGMLRSAHLRSADARNFPRFTNQRFLSMRLDGNKANGTAYDNGYGNYGTYSESSFEDIRIHDFPHYGFDPHENAYTGIPTIKLTIKDSLTDHNVVDGMTTDNCVDSTFINNIIDSNGRHGINVVTAASNNIYKNNVITNNLGNGITVQPGGDLNRTSNGNNLVENTIQGNKKDGIYIYRSKNTKISSNTVSGNNRHGIHIRSASSNTVSSNTVDENGLEKTNTYIGIYLDDDATIFSTNNLLENNLIRATTPNRYKYGIAEREARDDFNTLINNTFQGINIPISLRGSNSTRQ